MKISNEFACMKTYNFVTNINRNFKIFIHTINLYLKFKYNYFFIFSYYKTTKYISSFI